MARAFRHQAHKGRGKKDMPGISGLTCGITGIKAKVENRGQYENYLEELKPLREELGVSLKEDLYPEESK